MTFFFPDVLLLRDGNDDEDDELEDTIS